MKAVVLLLLATVSASDIGSRMKRHLLFPPNAGMGIYLAVSFPVDLPQYEISWSYNFEANYLLPTNATELSYGPALTEVRQARDITRKSMYSILEDRMKSEGYLGRSCLLRTICETSASAILGHNGLLGELLHIIFTPSSTATEDMPKEYEDAEKTGLKGKESCIRSYPECPVDLYDFFSVWDS